MQLIVINRLTALLVTESISLHILDNIIRLIFDLTHLILKLLKIKMIFINPVVKCCQFYYSHPYKWLAFVWMPTTLDDFSMYVSGWLFLWNIEKI